MRSITCRCDAVVEVDAPEKIDLDSTPSPLEKLADGWSPSAVCPRCGAVVRAEPPLRVVSASRNVDFTVISEMERLAAYRGKADSGGSPELLLGFQELFERARMLRDGLEPKAVEAMKYALQGKAEESEPAADVTVLYNGLKDGALEFHVLGLKSGQTGIVRLQRSSYDRTSAELPGLLGKEPYKTLFSGAYRSIKKLGFLSSAAD